MDTQKGAVEVCRPVVADSYHFDSSYDPKRRPLTHCTIRVYSILFHTGNGASEPERKLEGQ